MHLILWIFVGMVAGTLAKRAIPGEGTANLFTGVIGGLAGGWLFRIFLGHRYGEWMGSTLVAFVGAVVALLVVRAAVGRRSV
ncbi:MAG: GlsB/YeaQ/YmgE family stress response membrane protein [Verrucomicrobia bacterium]|nr:GlsB/YeaQ/YmgE family stress response membrane protein [Verrucomicrobiota bacterium]